MRLSFLCDANWESRVDHVLGEMERHGITESFSLRDYGAGLMGITVVFMCRDPELKFRRRVRFSRQERKIYMDIMLNLEQMRSAVEDERERIIADRLAEELPAILGKYTIPDFDSTRFTADLANWLGVFMSRSPLSRR